MKENTGLQKKGIFLLSVVLLASLAAGGIGSLSKISPKTGRLGDVLNGNLIKNFQKQFDRSIPVRGKGIQFWSTIKYVFFKEGLEGVLVGSDGWLFTTEEFVENLDEAMAKESFFQYASEVDSYFSQRDMELIILLIPSKSRVYREKLGRYEIPSNILCRYENTVEEFKARGVNCIDLNSLFASSGESFLYFKTDTHWTQHGAHLAAQAVKKFLPENPSAADLDRKYRLEYGDPLRFAGDLTAFLPHWKQRNIAVSGDDMYTKIYTEDIGASAFGLFDTPTIPVILVGTSYSFDERWGLEGFIKTELQLDVLNLAKEGKGPIEPMKELISEEYFEGLGTRYILWEIPERYIPVR